MTCSMTWARAALPAIATFALAFAPPAVHAEEGFPKRPIRLVLGFGPGTAVDILTRIVAAKVQASTNQAVIVDNKAGAGAMVALKEVARANPDGYTLSIAAMPTISIAPELNPGLDFNPQRDFEPVAGIADADLVMLIPEKRNPATHLKDFIDWSRKQPQGIFYGTLGAGTLGHFGGVLFSTTAGVKMDLVHYKDAGTSYTALVNGDVQAMLLSSSVGAAQVRSGSLRPIATTGATRSPSFPDVPTFKEQGFPAMEFGAWYGVFAPAKTPADVMDKLTAEFIAATRDPDVRARMVAAGFSPTGTSRSDFTRTVRTDTERWSRVAKSAGLNTK